MSDGGKDFALGMLIGGLIGAAVALLFAPMSGADTRRRVGEKAEELTEDARHKAADVAVSARERATEAARLARERAGEMTATVRERVGDAANQAIHRVDELRDRMTAAVDAGREAALEKREELEQRVEETAAPVIKPETT